MSEFLSLAANLTRSILNTTSSPALRTPRTVFAEKVEKLAETLETSILTYLTVSTRKRAGTNAFRPIYAPSLRYGENGCKLSRHWLHFGHY